MQISRREFLLLTAGLAGGCATAGGPADSNAARNIPIGEASQYAADGIYQHFRSAGFFVIRQGGKLFALSAICTHRRCKLDAKPDGTFLCPCHGSTFDPAGHVTQGPAQHDLPVFAVQPDAQGQLVVAMPAS